jgi:hypothetical protein
MPKRSSTLYLHNKQDYTIEGITAVLQTIKDCILGRRYIVSKNENRKENTEFISEYHLTSKKQNELLLLIKPKDFCHVLRNTNLGYEHEILYVFCPQFILYDFEGHAELVDGGYIWIRNRRSVSFVEKMLPFSSMAFLYRT